MPSQTELPLQQVNASPQHSWKRNSVEDVSTKDAATLRAELEGQDSKEAMR